MSNGQRLNRRSLVLGAGLVTGGTMAAPIIGSAQETCPAADPGATFVLVHGAWVGGWCWRETANVLRADGHAVYAPSLTGLADRSHLLSEELSLRDHVQDIVNLIRWEELEDIVLVGHSYGGMVISGVCEEVPEGTIRSIVYLDAFLPDDGESTVDQTPGLAAIAGDDPYIPVLPADVWGYTPEMGTRVDSLSTPHPRRTLFESLRLTGALGRIPTKTFVLATENLDENGTPIFQFAYDKAASRNGWRHETLRCPHDVMLFLPGETADVLRRAAS